jgi:hypothetical protein
MGDSEGDRGAAKRFATLPAGPGVPEGVAADGMGSLHVATFDINNPNVIHRLRHNGQFRFTIPLPGGVLPLGMTFDAAGVLLCIASSAEDRILKLGLATISAATALTTFAESINGADGILFDNRRRLWVAANEADEVVVLNTDGQVIAREWSRRSILHSGRPTRVESRQSAERAHRLRSLHCLG